MGHFLGADKIFFLIRDIEDPAMTAASVESCQFVAPRSPWVRGGMVLDVRKRLHRVRNRFHRWIHIGNQYFAVEYDAELESVIHADDTTANYLYGLPIWEHVRLHEGLNESPFY